MKKKIVIVGAGGFGREVLDIFDAYNKIDDKYDVLGFIVDSEYGPPGEIINDRPILGDTSWFDAHNKEISVVCAIGRPELRFSMVERLKQKCVQFCNVVHPHALLTRYIATGNDVIVTAGSILTNNIKIGNHVHINLNCTVGHDCVLDDFVTLAPGVHISGKVSLCTGCYVGTGVNIIDKIHVGEWSIIGAGSTVINDVPPNSTVVGIPGKVIKTREVGWQL